MSDDMELVRRYVTAQSEPAFAALVARYVNLVHSAALRQVGDTHLAQDITQAVFVILARKARSFGPHTIVSAWLYRTTRFAAIDALKSQRRRQRREQEMHMQASLNEPAEDAWEQIAPMLDEAMAQLGEKDRSALVLRYFENKTSREIAANLRVEEPAAQKRVRRALEKLRKIFSRRGVTLTTALIAGAVSAHSIQAAPAGLIISAAAAAQGSAVTGSTLALVKGALKLMTLAKLKSAALIGAAVIMATGTTVVVHRVAAQSNEEPLVDEAAWNADSRTLATLPPVLIIRPAGPTQGGGGVALGAGDKTILRAVPASELLATAYGIPSSRVVMPNDAPAERFDLMLTLPDHPKEALQAALKTKLGLVAHRETRETDVIILKVSRPDAPGLRPSRGGNRARSGGMSSMSSSGSSRAPGAAGSTSSVTINNQPLSNFTRSLEKRFGKVVLDQTGLTGNYDLELHWQSQPGESEADAVKRATLEQLGLDVSIGRGPLELLVVERSK